MALPGFLLTHPPTLRPTHPLSDPPTHLPDTLRGGVTKQFQVDHCIAGAKTVHRFELTTFICETCATTTGSLTVPAIPCLRTMYKLK